MWAGPKAGCVHELFEQQVERDPRAIALVADGRRVTYGELDARAERFAGRLRAAGVRRGDLVGVCLERGAGLVVALLAVLKAGAGHAVLDPGLPVARLRDMVTDARLRTVLHGTDRGVAELLGDGVRLVPVRDAAHGGVPGAGGEEDAAGAAPPRGGRARPDDIACVMFTSGSTGRPKGIAAPHHAITTTLTGQDYADFGPDAVWLQCAPVSWDGFVLELWGPLTNGGTCVLHPGMRPDPLVMRRLVAEHGVTDLYLSGSLFNVIVDEYPEALIGVQRLTVGGEALSTRHVGEALHRFPELRLRNGYGPAEGMIFLTTHPVAAEETTGATLPIGRPLAAKRVHVLDARLRPVPDGTVGELYAAGAGLAHGYAGQPARTAERFVPDPYGPPGGRMYRTGDLVRRRADGTLEFAGRADDQVKIHGFRVEPGEVEAALARHPGVERVAVTARPAGDGELRLVAYVVPRRGAGPQSRPDRWRAHARDVLPDFMVPADFVALDALPLLPTGKLDRAALPEPTPRTGRDPESEPHRSPAAQATGALSDRIADVWSQVLGVERVDPGDDFFDLGGNSLRAVRAAARLATAESLPVTSAEIFEHPTPAGLAARLTERPAPAPGADTGATPIPRRRRIPREEVPGPWS